MSGGIMKEHMRLPAVFACCLGFAAAASPDAAMAGTDRIPEPTAAVWDLSNLTRNALDADEMGAITQHIRVKLFNNMPDYRWLERGRIAEILDEQKFQASGCTEQDCVVEMGQLLGARKMVAGSISRVGDTYSLALNVIDIETGLVDKSVSEICPGCKEGQLYQLADNAVRALSGKASRKVVPRKEKSYGALMQKNRVNLAATATGAGLRTFPTDKSAVEFRLSRLERIVNDPAAGKELKMSARMVGARFYRYAASPVLPLQPYVGLEADVITSFESEASRGDGGAAGAFGGLEWFIARGVSVQTDISASYLQLADKAKRTTSSGIGYQMNFGVNLYFR